MPDIPVYLKTHADMPRPQDPVFYWCTGSGNYLCRNFALYESDVPTERPLRSLAAHHPQCRLKYPKLGAAALEYIVGFFSAAFEQHGSEAIVLLLWDLKRRRYQLYVPQQQATVWQSSSGLRTPLDVKYDVPVKLLGGGRYLLLGDIHGHGDHSADPSYTDRHDERYRDGIHAIVGDIEREPPEFCVTLVVDGYRFDVRPEDVFAGYRQRRRLIPKRWMEQLEITVRRPVFTYRLK